MNKIKLVKFTPLTLKKYVEEDEGDATLLWAVRMGYPRIMVYRHNKEKEIDYNKIIIAPFDYVNFSMLVTYLRNVIKSKKPISYTISCYNVEYKDNVKTDNIILQATVKVGKDSTGINYIELSAPNKFTIKFQLLPNIKWHIHDIKDETNCSVITNAELSNVYSNAYVTLLNKLILEEYSGDGKIEVMLDPPNSKNPITTDNVEDLI